MIRIDWFAVLRHFTQTMAFCLVISALLYFFSDTSYELKLVYSTCIGISTWLIIEFGRYILARDTAIGWPVGWRGFVLMAVGVLGGGAIGTTLADQWFGWSSWTQTLAQQRTSWLVTILAGGAATYYFYSQGKSASLQSRVQQAQRQAAEAQLKLLQSQLDPHMLFNTLANLRALIGVEPQAAQDMLDRMIAYLRATLSASRAATHPLSAEFDRLRDYLELMAVRMGPRLRYTLDLPDDLAGQPVPTLLLQPLVENSIKHGLEPKIEGGRIDVSARLDGGLLVLEVADTGVGPHTTDGGADGQGNGFGLAQVRERLATAYGDGASIDFHAAPAGGAHTRIVLPVAA